MVVDDFGHAGLHRSVAGNLEVAVRWGAGINEGETPWGGPIAGAIWLVEALNGLGHGVGIASGSAWGSKALGGFAVVGEPWDG